MIHNLVKSIVDVMNVNGNTFTFGHTQQSVQNINADQIQLPVVFLNMPVKYNPTPQQSGFIKTVFTCELFFLYKSNIDDGGGINESGETIAEQQQIEIFEQAFAAHRQFLNLLPKSVDVKEYKSNNAIQIQHVFDADLSGVYATIEIEPVDRSGNCENSLFPVPNCPESGYLIVNENGEVIVQGSLQAGQTLDVTISNSNINVTNSLDQSIGSSVVPAQENQTIQIPDVDNIDSDGSIVPTPAGVAFTCSPSSVSMNRFASKTGQTSPASPSVSYSDGDTKRGGGVDFFTLKSNNPFGNTLRFTGTTGTSTIQPDGIMIDWFHVEGSEVYTWFVTPQNGVNYAADISNAYNSTFGGLSNWFLPNKREQDSIMNHGISIATNWSPLNISPIILRTCTEDPNDNTKNLVHIPSTHGETSELKAFGNPRKWLPFRITTLTELGL